MREFVHERESAGPKKGAPGRPIKVGSARDAAEADADRLANAALASLRAGEHVVGPSWEVPGRVRRFSTVVSATANPAPAHTESPGSRIRRSTPVGAAGGELDGDVADGVRATVGGGIALPGRVRRRMEAGFGRDLPAVRIHTDGEADRLNRSMTAQAFTFGADVYFRSGRYRPDTAEGESLLAHELAHTLQPDGAAARRSMEPATVRRALEVHGTKWSEANRMTYHQGGSANGVFFVTDKAGNTIVLKTAGEGAATQVGVDIMEAADAPGVASRVVRVGSGEGKSMMRNLHRLWAKHRRSAGTAKGQNPLKNAVATKLPSGPDGSVLIMEKAANLATLLDVEELEDDERGDILDRMLQGSFFEDLGRIHAADALSGNEDRLTRRAWKNVFVDTATGGAVGLDIDVQLNAFGQLKAKDDEDAARHPKGWKPLADHNYQDFVTLALGGTDAKRTLQRGAATKEAGFGLIGRQATGNLRDATDPVLAKAVFDDIVAELEDRVGTRDAAVWAQAHRRFTRGLRHGLTQLAAKAPQLVATAEAANQNLGESQSADALALKVKLRYIEFVKAGFAEAVAVKLCVVYVEEMMLGGSDADFVAWLHEQHADTLAGRNAPRRGARRNGKRAPKVSAKSRKKALAAI